MSKELIVKVPLAMAEELNRQMVANGGESDLNLAAYAIALNGYKLVLDERRAQLFYSNQVKVDNFGDGSLTVKWTEDL